MLGSYAHLFVFLVLVLATFSLELELTGELSFDFKISDVGDRRGDNAVLRAKGGSITVAPEVECLYQYPDVEQFNAIMSHMMNELTKVFVRIDELIVHHSGRRRQETRFRVVDKKGTTFFERIFSNMTREYTSFFNDTQSRVSRAALDPCSNQEALKEAWRGLLERALVSLRRAAQTCVDEFVRLRDRADDGRFRYKLGQFLLRELPKVRISTLHQLCDHFQLCYNDLL